MVFKCLQGIGPKYLQELLKRKTSLQSLRVANDFSILHRSDFDKISDKNRRFEISAPILWNELPRTLREVKTLSEFKSKLKTFLFNQF